MTPEAEAAARSLAERASQTVVELAKRINIPLTPTSPPGLVQANVVDPWVKSGKYGLGWTYFAVALMGTVAIMRFWHFWQDKIRQAIYKQDLDDHYKNMYNVDTQFVMDALRTGSSAQFFPEGPGMGEKQFKPRAHFSSIGIVNETMRAFRWLFLKPKQDNMN